MQLLSPHNQTQVSNDLMEWWITSAYFLLTTDCFKQLSRFYFTIKYNVEPVFFQRSPLLCVSLLFASIRFASVRSSTTLKAWRYIVSDEFGSWWQLVCTLHKPTLGEANVRNEMFRITEPKVRDAVTRKVRRKALEAKGVRLCSTIRVRVGVRVRQNRASQKVPDGRNMWSRVARWPPTMRRRCRERSRRPARTASGGRRSTRRTRSCSCRRKSGEPVRPRAASALRTRTTTRQYCRNK